MRSHLGQTRPSCQTELGSIVHDESSHSRQLFCSRAGPAWVSFCTVHQQGGQTHTCRDRTSSARKLQQKTFLQPRGRSGEAMNRVRAHSHEDIEERVRDDKDCRRFIAVCVICVCVVFRGHQQEKLSSGSRLVWLGTTWMAHSEISAQI